jgi:CheY-specific phosphatase CheX
MHERILTDNARDVIFDSTQEILETMFFAVVEEEENDEDAGPDVGARVEFEGTWRGCTEARLNRLSSDAICRDFLGLDFDEDVEENQREHVVGELANMICGAALSRLEPNGKFNLRSPVKLSGSTPEEAVADGVRVVLPLELGRLEVRLTAA